MSGTHAHTAEAQADVKRADVQDRKPNIPPGHVEAERPIRRLGMRQSAPFLGAGAALVAVVVAVVILVT